MPLGGPFLWKRMGIDCVISTYYPHMAAWSAIETFEGYTAGVLNGDNGGSGWSAAWSTDTGIVVSILNPHTGANSVLINSITGGDGSRTLTTGVTSGIFRGYIEADNLPTGTKGFIPYLFYDGVTFRFRVDWGSGAGGFTGNTITFGSNSSTQVLSTTAVAGVWYYIDVEFDQTNNRARASFNGGAFSPYVTADGGSFTSITKLRITNADGNVGDQGYHIDDIGVGVGPITASRLFTLLGTGT